MDINFKRVLVLGSNSFTGSHFIQHLLEKTDAEIVGLSRSAEYNPIFLPYRYRKPSPARFKFYQIDLNNDFIKFSSLSDDYRPYFLIMDITPQ